MRRLALLAVALVASSCSCGDEKGCSNCPPLEGRYAMGYDTQTTSGQCSATNMPGAPPAVEISRVGSVARATLDGVETSGTVYDTFRFNLDGTGFNDAGTESINLHGTFVPPETSSDAGAKI